MKFLFLLSVSFFAFDTQAQYKPKHTDYNYLVNIRTSPFALLDPIENNLSIGADVKISKRFSTGADIAWFFARNFLNTPKQLTGFYIRPGIRYYTSNKLDFFAEAVFMYKYTSRNEEGWIGMDCVNEIPSYEKFDSYRFVKNVYDVSIRGGIRHPLSTSGKLFFEYYFGIGVGTKIHTIKYNEINSCISPFQQIDRGFTNINLTGSFARVSVPMGFRLTYRVQ